MPAYLFAAATLVRSGFPTAASAGTYARSFCNAGVGHRLVVRKIGSSWSIYRELVK